MTAGQTTIERLGLSAVIVAFIGVVLAFTDDLFNASDEEFADLIADGTIYLENGK